MTAFLSERLFSRVLSIVTDSKLFDFLRLLIPQNDPSHSQMEHFLSID